MPQPLRPAVLDWDGHAPNSRTFNDSYFHHQHGLAESRYVFLQHNQLPERWTNKDHFTIGETGFGTGLNFLATWQAWQQTATANARLHYIAIEKHPLTRKDLHHAHQAWPTLAPLAQQLQSAYPPALPGFHHRQFDQGRISLTLIFDDAENGLAQLVGQVDAWFLDGFAPSKNPEMWTPTLFAQLAQHSKPGTTFATFSAASLVKHGLTAAGFQIEKVAGFKKRDMLRGHYPHRQTTTPLPSYFAQPQPSNTYTASKKATIIGAGLAGSCTAYALAQRGFQVTVIDAGAGPAAAASGIPRAVLRPHLHADHNASSRFYANSFAFTIEQLKNLPAVTWQQSGALHLAERDKEIQRQEQLAALLEPCDDFAQHVSATRASEIAGYPLTFGGLYFPSGGWLDPASFCTQLLQHENIATQFNTNITTINNINNSWQSFDNDEFILGSKLLILATGAATALIPALGARVQPIRGQMSTLPSSAATQTLKTVLCYGGYITPAAAQQHTLGASFIPENTDLTAQDDEHQISLEKLAHAVPPLAEALTEQSWAASVGIRAATPDHLAIIGPAPNAAIIQHHFATLAAGKTPSNPHPEQYLPGLFLHIGHGSRGATGALLGAALLAAQINDEVLPVDMATVAAMHPARFLVRRLKKPSRR